MSVTLFKFTSHFVYSPLNSYLYIHWILDFKYILLLLDIIFLQETERTNFYTTVREYVLHNIGQNFTVMAGDFNCTLNPKYDRASQVESHKHSANLLRDLVKELCLTECYRHVNPNTRLYTWHNIRSLARLDRIYVSTFLKSHIQCITSRGVARGGGRRGTYVPGRQGTGGAKMRLTKLSQG